MLAPAGRRRAGISLIEVLAALAIFLMSIVAIGRLVDIGTDSAVDATAQATGVRLAQSKLAEVEAGVIPVADGGSGTFDDEPNWEYTVESGPTDLPNLYAVTVTVTRARGRSHSVTMTQMVFDPTQTGTATPAAKPETTTGGGAAP